MAATNWETAWAVEISETGAPVGRMVSHLAADGREGVVSPQDCVLTPMSPATLRAKLSPGAVTAKVRTPGQNYQTYLSRLPVDDYIDFTAAPSAARSDLVVAVIRNPYLDPQKYTAPVGDAAYTEKYVYTEVWKNVGAGVTMASQVDSSVSAVALWRVDIPKGAAAVTLAMFKDLRKAVNTPPFDAAAFYMDVKNLVGSNFLPQSGTVNRLDKRPWPDTAFWDVPVPSWATSGEAFVQFNPSIYGGNTWGALYLDFNGRLSGACEFDVNMDDDFWNVCKGGAMRQPYTAGGAWAINPEERGTYRRLMVRADTYGASPFKFGQSSIGNGCLALCQVIFKQSPSSL